jgi:hypothetical protein
MTSQDGEWWEPPEVHRNHDLDEIGVSQVVITRFLKDQLPLLLKMKEEMDAGMVLSEGELELLERMLEKPEHLNRFVYEHREYRVLVGKIVSLLDDIADEALDNETRKIGD